MGLSETIKNSCEELVNVIPRIYEKNPLLLSLIVTAGICLLSSSFLIEVNGNEIKESPSLLLIPD